MKLKVGDRIQLSNNWENGAAGLKIKITDIDTMYGNIEFTVLENKQHPTIGPLTKGMTLNTQMHHMEVLGFKSLGQPKSHFPEWF